MTYEEQTLFPEEEMAAGINVTSKRQKARRLVQLVDTVLVDEPEEWGLTAQRVAKYAESVGAHATARALRHFARWEVAGGERKYEPMQPLWIAERAAERFLSQVERL